MAPHIDMHFILKVLKRQESLRKSKVSKTIIFRIINVLNILRKNKQVCSDVFICFRNYFFFNYSYTLRCTVDSILDDLFVIWYHGDPTAKLFGQSKQPKIEYNVLFYVKTERTSN